jgi:hypothetical protein
MSEFRSYLDRRNRQDRAITHESDEPLFLKGKGQQRYNSELNPARRLNNERVIL